MLRTAPAFDTFACLVIVAGFASMPSAAQPRSHSAPAASRGSVNAPVFPGKEYLVSGQNAELYPGDFDGDGTQDLLVYTVNDDQRTVLHGQGGGDFAPWVGPVTTIEPRAVVDVDGDGKDDLLSWDRDKLVFERSDGKGSFTPLKSSGLEDQHFRPIVFPHQLDRNGTIDLVIATTRGEIWSFLGNGDGTFERVWTNGKPTGYEGVVTGDFDEDGLIDIAGRIRQNKVAMFLGMGDGSFRDGPFSVVQGWQHPFGVLDFDRDGHLDVLVTTLVGDTGFVQVMSGLGNGRFKTPAPIDGLDACESPAIGDWNDDGLTDIACPDALLGTVRVLLSGPAPSARRLVTVPVWITPYGLGAVDTVNGDALLLVVGASDNPPATNITVLPPFTETVEFGMRAKRGDFSSDSVCLGAGDVDHDGDVDLVTFDDYSAQLMKNDGSGGFPTAPDVVQSFSPGDLTAARVTDLNGDGDLDLVWAKNAPLGTPGGVGEGIGFALGRGDGTFAPATLYPMPGARLISFDIADLDSDGRRDMVVANQGTISALAIYYGAPGDTHVRVDVPSDFLALNAIVAADFDEDGILDLASGFFFGGGVEVRRGLGAREYADPVPYLSQFNTWAVAAVDIDLDGHMDLIASSYGLLGDEKQLAVLLGDGMGGFAPGPFIPIAIGMPRLAVGDWTGDGHDDLAVPFAVPGRELAVIPSDASSVALSTSYFANGTPVAADLNEDGVRDIATIGQRWSHRYDAALWILTSFVPPPPAASGSGSASRSSFPSFSPARRSVSR